MQNSSKTNCSKAEITGKNYKANRTLRIRIVRGRLKSLYLWALSASVTLDCITIAFLYLPVVRSSELIMRVISNAFGSRCEVNYSA